MSRNKFTPGPWVVRKWRNGDEWPDRRVSIASKYNGEALFINARYAKDIEANANLIAAAPELLEALDGLVKVLEPAWSDFTSDESRAMDKALSAIIKARVVSHEQE